MTELKKCFVICPIGEEGSPQRLHSDDLFDVVLKPIAEVAGYVAHRAIDKSRPGDITDAIMNDISSADLIIADITGANPNVFYELALAHVWGRPYILLSADDPLKVPFDINAQHVIRISRATFRAQDVAREAIKSQIEAIKSGSSIIENPVKRFLNRSQMEASGDPEKAVIASMSRQLSEMEKRLESLESSRPVRIVSPNNSVRRTYFNRLINENVSGSRKEDLMQKRLMSAFEEFINKANNGESGDPEDGES